MSPENSDQFENNQDPNAGDGASTPMLDAETYGQIVDDNNPSGQAMADLEDDSMRMDREARTLSGPAPASDENLPRELTDPSDRAFTLPEEQEPSK
ncbi:hypothetical protein AUC43_17905 [Hymenobacter sedentarius]|uniref:Uncharacterized protein n=1 Tax=Hymenobacter sedentarius TaxID=1411621 RepID=A0A0U4AT60_9BACT|nr:hypothetical protein [Hymenobacter sedentarius]ALW86789.1 hypothetical protein AUC43_17905 [Hymenobacter sedentarius]